MQLRSGKKLETCKAPDPTLFDKHVFTSSMTCWIKRIADSPSRSMERLSYIVDMLHYGNLDINSKIAKYPKYCLMVIDKCNQFHRDLLELVADKQTLTSTEKKTVMRMHDCLTKTIIKYQGYTTTASLLETAI